MSCHLLELWPPGSLSPPPLDSASRRLSNVTVSVALCELKVLSEARLDESGGLALLLDTLEVLASSDGATLLAELTAVTGLSASIVRSLAAQLVDLGIVALDETTLRLTAGVRRADGGIIVPHADSERLVVVGTPPCPLWDAKPGSFSKLKAICRHSPESLGFGEATLERWRSSCWPAGTIGLELIGTPDRLLFAGTGLLDEKGCHLHLVDGLNNERLELPADHPATDEIRGRVTRCERMLPEVFRPFGTFDASSGKLKLSGAGWERWIDRRGAMVCEAVVEDSDGRLALVVPVECEPNSEAAARSMFADAVLLKLEETTEDLDEDKVLQVCRGLRRSQLWRDVGDDFDPGSLADLAWSRSRWELCYRLSAEGDGL